MNYFRIRIVEWTQSMWNCAILAAQRAYTDQFQKKIDVFIREHKVYADLTTAATNIAQAKKIRKLEEEVEEVVQLKKELEQLKKKLKGDHSVAQ